MLYSKHQMEKFCYYDFPYSNQDSDANHPSNLKPLERLLMKTQLQ